MKKSVTVLIIFIMMQFRLIAMVQNQDLKECYCAYFEKSIKILSQHFDDYIPQYKDKKYERYFDPRCLSN
jgi:hypothetical protein